MEKLIGVVIGLRIIMTWFVYKRRERFTFNSNLKGYVGGIGFIMLGIAYILHKLNVY